MATGIRICKICGKEYPYCKTVVQPGSFRWQDVACSPEHGEEYFSRILASRAQEQNAKDEPAVEDAVAVVNAEVSNSDEPVTVKKSRRKKVKAVEATIDE